MDPPPTIRRSHWWEVGSRKVHIGRTAMAGPEILLRKRKLEDALSVIDASMADLDEKRRACEEPLWRAMCDNLAALPVFVFICNI